jgi:hypothetical protein
MTNVVRKKRNDKISDEKLLVTVGEPFDTTSTIGLAIIQDSAAPYPLDHEKSKISLSELCFGIFFQLAGTDFLGMPDNISWT